MVVDLLQREKNGSEKCRLCSSGGFKFSALYYNKSLSKMIDAPINVSRKEIRIFNGFPNTEAQPM